MKHTSRSSVYNPLCEEQGIAHRRVMAFHQETLQGCSLPPPTTLPPLAQSWFSSRAHFLKRVCFKSKMNDISETATAHALFLLSPSLRTLGAGGNGSLRKPGCGGAVVSDFNDPKCPSDVSIMAV